VSTADLTVDRFLGGRVTAAQPADGFRAGHDTVLLAAAVPADRNSAVLELGSGAGVASLCLAARVPGARITGIEIDPELVRIANENASRNAVADRVSFMTADISDISMKPGSFDHVFFNPPFHPDTGQISPIGARDRATRDTAGAVAHWTRRALLLARHGGTVTAIVRADRVGDILIAGAGYNGIVFPLLPRAGAEPKRTVVRLETTNGTVAIDAGLILHELDGRNTEAAENVLRHAAPLW
jgi:tRNA1Val (adenine37-N6)-methyltransferase